jgi:thiosulfate/3-mercaptopyruvate sulfurtransferase
MSIKRTVIAGLLVLAVMWSLGSAAQEGAYPRSDFLATPRWVAAHKGDDGVVVVDVREDKYFDGRVIPGAVRLPWRAFRKNDLLYGLGGVFVGLDEAQKVLGEHGITRSDTVVLYDSVERDGGATSSYVFWVLDLLGHERIKVLDRGIDGWQDAGQPMAETASVLEPVLYQAPVAEVRVRRRISGQDIYQRLGDPHYQIVDVRSAAEYLGEKPNTGLDGTVLKLGHIPTAFNVDYTHNWASPETKAVKSPEELAGLYAGLDPAKGAIVYCHSGRRGSYGYFILRLMGFQDVMLYENSWFEWGSPDNFYPVETRANMPSSTAAIPSAPGGIRRSQAGNAAGATATGSGSAAGTGGSGGYISCGG